MIYREKKMLLSILMSISLLSACSHSRVHNDGGVASTRGAGGLLGSAPKENFSTGKTNLNQSILGVHLQNTNFDIPVVYNSEVENWVEYFTGQGRKYFGVYLDRMNEYTAIIKPKLKAAGMPQDLIFLAMIESGFSTQAKSWCGAVGQWQFMKSTGHLYGLKTDWWVDERRDPSKEADAAVEYLGRLHAEFGSWELATAAYNSGEGRIRSAISRLHTHDFWELARNRRALRRETKDYVPKMMAAAIIAKNAEQFGFRVNPPDARWLHVAEVKIPKTENLRTIAKVADIDWEELRALNPELLRCCTPPKSGPYSLRIPEGQAATKILAAIEAGEIGRYQNFGRHVIRRGDTLSRIAASYHMPVEAILAMNDLGNARQLKPGTELVIPEGGSSSRGLASASAPTPQGRKHLLYTVQKGDTLSTISRRYAVQIKQIRAWNSLRRSKNLRPGRRLKLYVSNDNPKEDI